MDLPPPRDEVRISDYLRVLYRRRFLALLSFLAVFISVTIHTFLTTPVYEAQSTIQIKDQAKKSLLSELIQIDQTNTIGAEIEIIKSRTVAEAVVRKLKLDTVLYGFPRGLGLEFENLSVGRKLKGKVFTLTFKNKAGDFVVANKDGELGKGRLGQPFHANSDDPKFAVSFKCFGSGHVPGMWFRFAQLPLRVAVQNVQNSTDVRPVGDKTQILRVFCHDSNPQKTRNVVNAIVETYRRRNIDENAQEARETLKFIEGQKTLVHEQVTASEKALRDYKEEFGIVSLPEEATQIIENYAKFAVEKSRLDIEMKHHYTVLAALKQSSPAAFGLPAVNMENTVLSNMGLKLSELLTKRQELLALYTETHPEVLAVQAQIEEMTETLRQVVKNTLASLKARKTEIEKVMEDYYLELKALPDKERALAELVRSREVSSGIYTFLLQKREEARITEAATIGNIRVIDEAELPLRPIKPNVRLNLLLGLIAGLLLAVAVTFFLEFIDDSLKSTEEVERFIKKPIYGIIPRIPPRRHEEGPEPRSERGSERRPSAISANLVTHHSPKSPISEAFRTLRTNIHFADPDKPITEILISSAGPSEGKSTIVSNLALTVAATGKKTLLIDCDLRKPNVHNFFDLERDPGVTTILSGKMSSAEAIQQSPAENLSILTAGPIPPNPTEMLSSKTMRDLVEKFRKEFDMVLLDSPPVVAVTDAAILGSFLQATLLVVELGRARASSVNRAIDLLEKVNANLLGLVTNNISAGYRYDYSYYSYYYYSETGEKKKRHRGRYGY